MTNLEKFQSAVEGYIQGLQSLCMRCLENNGDHEDDSRQILLLNRIKALDEAAGFVRSRDLVDPMPDPIWRTDFDNAPEAEDVLVQIQHPGETEPRTVNAWRVWGGDDYEWVDPNDENQESIEINEAVVVAFRTVA